MLSFHFMSICHFAHLSSLSYLPHCLLLYLSFFLFLPVQTGCINAGSHMLLAESQLSLLSQSDGPGHTSGNPWLGSPLPSLLRHPHPLYGADWIEIFRWLLRLLKQQNRYRTKTLRGGLSFISPLSRGYTCSCSRAFQHYAATQHLSIIN